MTFNVTEVTDGDTFVVTPDWKWNGKTGDKVRPVGYNTPERGEPGFDEAKEKLGHLAINEEVELVNPIQLSFDRLLCTVLLNGKDLADYFPEYQ